MTDADLLALRRVVRDEDHANAQHRPDGDCFSCRRLLDDGECALIVEDELPRAAFLARDYREGSDPHRVCGVYDAASPTALVVRLRAWGADDAAIAEFRRGRRAFKKNLGVNGDTASRKTVRKRP